MRRFSRAGWLIAAALTLAVGTRWMTDRLPDCPNRVAIGEGEEIVLPPAASSVEGVLSGDGALTYLVALEAGDLLHVRAIQDRVDLRVSWQKPDGCEVLIVDSPNGPSGPEELAVRVNKGGAYRLELRGPPGSSGERFQLEVLHRGQANREQRSLADAMVLYAEGEAHRREGHLTAALEVYQLALEEAQAASAGVLEARTRRRAGLIAYQLGDVGAAIEHFDRAIPVLRATENGWEIAAASNDAGDAYAQAGRPAEAQSLFEEALAHSQALGNLPGMAASHNNLGVLQASIGNLQAAIGHYQRALEGWQSLGDLARQAPAMHNLGVFHAYLRRYDEGQDFLRRAAEIHDRFADTRALAETLTSQGWVHLEAGEPEPAIAIFDRAMRSHRAIGDRRGQAVTLDLQGKAYRAAGAYAAAGALHEQALALNRKAGNRLQEAHSHDQLGRLRLAEGRLDEALAHHQASLAGFQGIQNLEGEATALASLARVQHRLGQLEPARDLMAEAVRIFESSRARLQSLSNRSQYFELRLDDLATYIDVLMELDRQSPQAGYGAQAFQMSERLRARSLLDSLGDSGLDSNPEVPARLRSEEARLRTRIARLEASRLQAAAEGLDEDTRPLDRELRTLLLEYETLRGEIRFALGSTGAAEPLDLDAIRRLIDEETLLLAYHLGEEESYLWLVDHAKLESHRLGPGAEIERLARQAHRLLSRQESRTYGEQTAVVLKHLSETLLRPLADRPAGQRLVVMAAGALHLVPFAALTDPGANDGEAQPLVRRHEVVHWPSASVVAHVREIAGRRTAAKQLAVLADPIFERDDPRLRAATLDPGAQAPENGRTSQALDDDFRRLPFSGQEAAAILALVPEDERVAALGARASREVARSGVLRDFRIVHFATHGVLDARHPELAGLVLTLLDAGGGRVDGFLRAYEIADLRLQAELVVLSACKTALGEVLRSEGLVGLPYSFFRAGAPRVVVSYWNVNDRATSVLMEEFYRRMLGDGLRPAAALQAAQISMLNDERWQAPYFWAGFTLQGDWR